MSTRKCLVLTQYRNGSEYNDFIGHYYHFPNNSTKNYSAFFKELPLEFILKRSEKKYTMPQMKFLIDLDLFPLLIIFLCLVLLLGMILFCQEKISLRY